MTTLSASVTLRVQDSTPTRHHFHPPADTGDSYLDGIHQRLAAEHHMYVTLDDGQVSLFLTGTPGELRAWVARLVAYVDEAEAALLRAADERAAAASA